MNKLVFCTDLHLNFATTNIIQNFALDVRSYNPDLLVIAGDISECPTLELYLAQLYLHLGNTIPIYFVCGNHDYYRGSIKDSRIVLNKIYGPNNPKIKWLPACDVITLSPGVALAGCDGWYDMGHPNWALSDLYLTDFNLIHEYKGVYRKQPILQVSRKIAIEEAALAKRVLKEAFNNHDKVFFVTHVPPWKENSCAPDGTMSDYNWMPCFSSKIMGDTIENVMKKLPHSKELIVLTGHSHTQAKYKPLPNVTCITGKGEYESCFVDSVYEY